MNPITSSLGHSRSQRVDIYTDMVIIHVSKLLVLINIELDSENMVFRVAVVGFVEDSEVASGSCAAVVESWDHDEGEAVPWSWFGARSDGENERSLEWVRKRRRCV